MSKYARIILYSNGRDDSYKFPLNKMPDLVSELKKHPNGSKNYSALNLFYKHATECRNQDMDISLNVLESQDCAVALEEVFLK